jgi:hypothetical protein
MGQVFSHSYCTVGTVMPSFRPMVTGFLAHRSFKVAAMVTLLNPQRHGEEQIAPDVQPTVEINTPSTSSAVERPDEKRKLVIHQSISEAAYTKERTAGPSMFSLLSRSISISSESTSLQDQESRSSHPTADLYLPGTSWLARKLRWLLTSPTRVNSAKARIVRSQRFLHFRSDAMGVPKPASNGAISLSLEMWHEHTMEARPTSSVLSSFEHNAVNLHRWYDMVEDYTK